MPVIPGERSPFLSAPNFRDLGGLPTIDGRTVRRRTLFRSEAPIVFERDDFEKLDDLGIRLVCDLRHSAEIVASEPTLSGVRNINIPVLPEVRTGGSELMQQLIADSTGRLAQQNMIESYSVMPTVFEPHFANLVTAIIDGNIPLLVHCTAGKDRSGFVVALLLTAIGVPREEVLADYERSGEVQGRDVIRQLITGPASRSGLSEESVISDEVLDAMTVDEAYLEAAFVAAAELHGSLDRYIEIAGRLDGERRWRLREALLE